MIIHFIIGYQMLIILFCLYKINKKLIIKSINNLLLIIKTKEFPHKNK